MKIFDNRPDIKSMFHRLNKEHFGGEIPDIPVVWNGRMTTTAGYCRYRQMTPMHPEGILYVRGRIEPWKIDLSDKLFKSLGYDLQKIERTLIHEMVHAYLAHKYDEGGHTARFQRMMTQITGENINHRCHNYDISEVRREARYTLVCHRCGHEHGMSRKPKHPYYKHRKCGGKMTLGGPPGGVLEAPKAPSPPKSIKIF
jgi:predicted SprT family Zn-dependent metalloprotease